MVNSVEGRAYIEQSEQGNIALVDCCTNVRNNFEHRRLSGVELPEAGLDLTLKSLNCYKHLTYFMVFMLFSNTAECCNYEQIINANVMSQLLKSRQLQGGFAPLTA